jgi:hypothetical protein
MSLLGERVTALEEYLEMIGIRQERHNSDKKDLRFYQQAIDLADQGLSAEELAQRCGISSSEAELITMLYQKANGVCGSDAGRLTLGVRHPTKLLSYLPYFHYSLTRGTQHSL